MTMAYLPKEGEFLKQKRLEADPSLELFYCEDGLFRTKEEKEVWDNAMGWGTD